MINFTANGKARNLGTFRSVLDFFFPYPLYDKNGVGIIRREAVTRSNRHFVISRRFYTFRAFFMHYWYSFVKLFEINAEIFYMNRRLNFRRGAIGTDANSGYTVQTTSSTTFAHTCTGTDLCLVIGTSSIHGSGAVHPTGVTYNSDSVTELKQGTYVDPFMMDIYGMVNPDTGANNVVVTWAASTENIVTSSSYSGVSQTGLPDSSNSGNSAAGVASYSLATVVVADNCWLVGAANSFGTTLQVDNTVNNTTLVIAEGGQDIMFDSAGVVSTGSQALGVKKDSGTTQFLLTLISIAPAAAGGGGGGTTTHIIRGTGRTRNATGR